MIETPGATFSIPDSVSAYLSDPAIRAGVDALLDVNEGALPPELELSEFGDYLAARAAAGLTKLEWAVMVHSLWNTIWAPLVQKPWTFSSLDELVDEDIAITPSECWASESFQMYHRQGEYILRTAVLVERRKTSVAFSIETNDGGVLIGEDIDKFVWKDDDYWNGWLMFSVETSPAEHDFKLAKLQDAARHAMELVREAM